VKFLTHILAVLILMAVLVSCSQTGAAGSGTSAKPSAYIQNKGSDTMVNLALAWAERYQQEHAQVSLSVTGGGSGTGITSLLNGTVDIANASRAITPDEIKTAKTNGFVPVEFTVARDAIAVIVNPENPVQRLSLPQLSKIYRGVYNNWQQVGGENRPIVRLSRETNSGTHVYFLETVIRLGSSTDKNIFSADTLLLPSSEGIIAELRDNPNAIGYDGLGYVTPDVKVIAVSQKDGGPYIMPSAATVNDKTYPISRDLYMYTHGQPSGAILDYLNWLVSPEAQQIVTDLGFVPIVKK
jgi:phosphate transport system substrate-binding protein